MTPSALRASPPLKELSAGKSDMRIGLDNELFVIGFRGEEEAAIVRRGRADFFGMI